ncbi:hypothetical protein [Actinomadura sp. 9N407]|uniref:hypothetical protein n=1 Tax=Actinomadura sp. 9N407 TaxID=3375154 RepID=UPI0037B9B7A6
MTDPQAIEDLRRLLARSGLVPSDAELAALAGSLEAQQMGIELLYAVPEARYADPALRFRAGARMTDWSPDA